VIPHPQHCDSSSIASPRALAFLVAVHASLLAFGVAPPPAPTSSLKSLEGVTRAEVVRRVLIDRALKRRAVQEVVLEESTIRFRDAAGRPGSTPRENILALLPPEDVTDGATVAAPAGIVWREITDLRAESHGRIELADGQLFPGRIADGTPRPGSEEISWIHPLLGRMEFRLDNVSFVLINSEGSDDLRALGQSSGDVVGLTNRDRVEGFIAAVGAEVSVEVGPARKPAAFPTDRVSYLRFASNTKSAAISGPRVWFHDGTVAAATAVASDAPETLSLKIPAAGDGKKSIRLGAGEIVAIALDSSKIRPLASIPTSPAPAPAAGEVQRVFIPRPITRAAATAPLGAADIELPGPMTADWILPSGVTRIAGGIELPNSCRAWGDCIVTVTVADKQHLQQRINGEHPRADFNISLEGGASAGEITGAKYGGPIHFKVTIDPGESGPVQDRIVLKSVLMLVDNK
jgi:hypothetical protein